MKQLTLKTNLGAIRLELDEQKAPLSVRYFWDNFESGRFESCHFYRVVKKSQLVGGLPTIDIIQGGVGWDVCGDIPSIPLETTRDTGLAHRDGTISLARSKPGLSDCEFFICIGEQPKLDYGGTEGAGLEGFAAFGQVVEGMDVVRTIQNLPANILPPGVDERFKNEFLDTRIGIRAVPDS